MKEEFRNKKICIFGASIDEHGWYMDYMRRYIGTQEEKCYIFNRSIGGSYCRLADRMVDDEIGTLNPDIVFIHLGENDTGVYNYDVKYDGNAEMDAKKARSDAYFYKGIKNLALKIQAMGPKVYIMSTFAMNQYIEEKDNIESVYDNEEKVKYLNSSFYKQASLKNVNEKFKIHTEKTKEIAKEIGVEFVDFFTPTYNEMIAHGNMHDADGIHYSQRGHEIVAKIFLEYLGYQNVPDSLYFKNDTCSIINQLEQTERHIQFFRRWKFYVDEEKPYPEISTDEQIIAKVREMMKDNPKNIGAFMVVADEFWDDFNKLRDMIYKITMMG